MMMKKKRIRLLFAVKKHPIAGVFSTAFSDSMSLKAGWVVGFMQDEMKNGAKNGLHRAQIRLV